MTFGYRAELDGVRAIGVLLVMVAHSGYQAGNGYFGVELFFALSGYLITALLLREFAREGRIDFRVFYLKRAYRLLPALFAVLAAVGLFAVTLADADDRPGIGTGLWSSAIYVSNWVRAFGTDLEHLGHTWSLAIEEQFYLVWPPLLGLMLVRRWPMRRIAGVVAAIVVAVILWRHQVHSNGATWERTYSGFDTRGSDTLMAGALLAIVEFTTPITAAMRRVATVAGVLACAAIALTVTEAIPWTPLIWEDGWSFSALICLAAVSWVVLAPTPLLTRCLSLSPMVWIGVRSYGLYLWHYPIFRMLEPLKDRYGNSVYGPVAWALSFAVAALSFRLIEQPFLRRKQALVPPSNQTADAPAPSSAAPTRDEMTQPTPSSRRTT